MCGRMISYQIGSPVHLRLQVSQLTVDGISIIVLPANTSEALLVVLMNCALSQHAPVSLDCITGSRSRILFLVCWPELLL